MSDGRTPFILLSIVGATGVELRPGQRTIHYPRYHSRTERRFNDLARISDYRFQSFGIAFLSPVCLSSAQAKSRRAQTVDTVEAVQQERFQGQTAWVPRKSLSNALSICCLFKPLEWLHDEALLVNATASSLLVCISHVTICSGRRGTRSPDVQNRGSSSCHITQPTIPPSPTVVTLRRSSRAEQHGISRTLDGRGDHQLAYHPFVDVAHNRPGSVVNSKPRYTKIDGIYDGMTMRPRCRVRSPDRPDQSTHCLRFDRHRTAFATRSGWRAQMPRERRNVGTLQIAVSYDLRSLVLLLATCVRIWAAEWPQIKGSSYDL
nr:hypothetical protein CFP56_63965 [Quercus suber]